MSNLVLWQGSTDLDNIQMRCFKHAHYSSQFSQEYLSFRFSEVSISVFYFPITLPKYLGILCSKHGDDEQLVCVFCRTGNCPPELHLVSICVQVCLMSYWCLELTEAPVVVLWSECSFASFGLLSFRPSLCSFMCKFFSYFKLFCGVDIALAAFSAIGLVSGCV